MNTTDVMKDPGYTPILAAIEIQIVKADVAAEAQGIPFTDAQVRSILNKARKQAEGGSPKLPTDSARDQALEALYRNILHAREDVKVEDMNGNTRLLPAQPWILALRTVEDSVRRHSTGSGSRDYLEFIRMFIP